MTNGLKEMSGANVGDCGCNYLLTVRPGVAGAQCSVMIGPLMGSSAAICYCTVYLRYSIVCLQCMAKSNGIPSKLLHLLLVMQLCVCVCVTVCVFE